MGRKKRGYQRTIGKLRDYHLFAVACEGSVREWEYFKMFESLSSRISVDLIGEIDEDGLVSATTNSSPDHVLKRAEAYCNEAGLGEGDEVWLVLDVDRWGSQKLSDLCSEAANRKWHTAISNPCFEVWLCYHISATIEDGGKELSSAEMKQLLATIASPGGYNCQIFARLAFSAADHARTADKHQGFRIPKYKETQVYHLIDAMKSYTSIEEIERFVGK